MSINTDIIKATKAGDLISVKALLEKGADLFTTVGDVDKRNLLHHAAQKGHDELILFFLENGIPIESEDQRGRTALYLACMEAQFSGVKTLVENGAKINISGQFNPLDVASSNSFYGTEIIAYLLENGADVNLICRGANETPLMGALHQEKPEALKMLLAAGANTNHISLNGEAPLGRVAQHDFPIHVELLLAHQANINHQNRKGNTALHLATIRNNKNVVKVLIKAGIKVNTKNKKGETALDIAKKSNTSLATFIAKLVEENYPESKKNGFFNKLGRFWK